MFIAVIFRGQGKRISQVEKQAWDKDVDVYFQKRAWADKKFCINHIEKTLKTIVEKEPRFVLFCDNLTSQSKPAFRESISKLNGVVWCGLKKWNTFIRYTTRFYIRPHSIQYLHK